MGKRLSEAFRANEQIRKAETLCARAGASTRFLLASLRASAEGLCEPKLPVKHEFRLKIPKSGLFRLCAEAMF
jgi:hypothetical protein